MGKDISDEREMEGELSSRTCFPVPCLAKAYAGGHQRGRGIRGFGRVGWARVTC